LIRINLFPIKEIKKKINILQLTIINLIFFVFFLGCIGFGYKINHDKIIKLNKSIKKEEQKLKKLAYLRKQIREFKKKKKILETKLKIINQLDSNRLFPSYLFYILSKQIPKDIWLTNINFNKNIIKIQGISIDEDTVVKFINNLKNSNSFKNINLIQINQIIVNKIRLKEFYLQLSPDYNKLLGLI